MSPEANVYETDELLSQYLLFHYGQPEDQLPWPNGPRDALDFPVRCVTECVDTASLPEHARALDLGCAVGRSTFELARHCDSVIGVDFSYTFIFAARTLCRDHALPFEVLETGSIYRELTAHLPDVPCHRVRFEQGDAQRLRPNLGSFDVVLACNLLCRLPRPQLLLERLPDLVKPGGQLVITTPNSWLDTFTAKEYWLGATPATGEPLEALEAALSPHFELVQAKDLPFLIREHRRKYQWSVAQASIWRRRQPSA
ncbi:MAG: putative 4-mercaptohistidine N1-methyltransferase [Verrucomicrobiota bacterium JB022]|nr:putative 4-mercaptohistidine N1-methyltransferase [Verrucomicrobiota bacterium JB022]